MTAVLPYVHLTWDKPTPPAGVSFVRYRMYRDGARLIAPSGQIDTLDDIDTEEYRDYLASPGVEHEYSISWVGEDGGVELESALSTPASAELVFTGGWLHEVDDADEQARIRGNALTVHPQRAQAWRRPRHRQQGTAYFGRQYQRDIEVGIIPELLTDAAMWEALDRMAERETTTGGVLCLRLGFRAGARYLVSSTDLTEQMQTSLSRASIAFREAFYVELE